MSKANYKFNRMYDFNKENETAALKIFGNIVLGILFLAVVLYLIFKR